MRVAAEGFEARVALVDGRTGANRSGSGSRALMNGVLIKRRLVMRTLLAVVVCILFAPSALSAQPSDGRDGALGQWEQLEFFFPADAQAAAVGNGLFSAGGRNSSLVHFFPTFPSVAVQVEAGNLSGPRWNGFTAVFQNHVFILGGVTTGNVRVVTIERVTFVAPSTFTIQTVGMLPVSSLTRGATDIAPAGFAVIVGERLYVFGAAGDLYTAGIDANGTLGPFIRLADAPEGIQSGGFTAGFLFTRDRFGIIRRATVAPDGELTGWVGVASSPYRVFVATNNTLYRGTAPGETGNWDYTDAVSLGPWERLAEPQLDGCGITPWVITIGERFYVWSPCGQNAGRRLARALIGGLLISNLSPRVVSESGGARVTLTGSNIDADASVTIDGIAASIEVIEARRIVFITVPHVRGRVSVVVRNPDSQTWLIPASHPNALEYVECEVNVGTRDLVFPGSGGVMTITVTARAGDCPWSASSSATWISLPSSGAGTTAVPITVAPNPLPLPRSGTILVAARVITIFQQGGTATGPPGPPTQLAALVQNGVIDFIWTPPASGSLTHYVLEAGSVAGGVDLGQIPIAATATTFRVENVPIGLYFVRLRAFGASGPGGVSNEVVVLVGDCQSPPPPPTGFSIAKLSSSDVRLAWNAPSGRVTSYVVRAGSTAGGADLANFDTGTDSTTLDAAAPPGIYFVRVYARNACGLSGPSNEVPLILP
jgi:hypothetical protein